MNSHCNADNTQLWTAVSSVDSGPIDAFFNCILDIRSVMATNFVLLNHNKTEVL